MAVAFVVPLAFAVAAVIVPTLVTAVIIPAILSTVILTIIPTIVSAVILAITMPFLIIRNILVFVPVVVDKENPFAAGVVLAAMLAPMFGMARRNAQVNGRAVHRYPTLNDDRTTVDHPGLGEVADVDVAVKPGLADAHRNANVASERRGGKSGSSYCRDNQETFHLGSPCVGIL
jgi:hypothetical protein